MIMNVFKRKRRNKQGKLVSARLYTGRYKMTWMDKPVEVPLEVTDKRVAEQRLSDIIKRAELEHAGLALPQQQVEAANTPLLDHLVAFIEEQKTRRHNKQYISDINSRISRLCRECSWVFIKDVEARDFMDWRVNQDEMSPKTANDYLAAASGFFNWLVSRGDTGHNPFATVTKLRIKGRQKKRRAFTPEEFGRLLKVGGPRGVLYMTAVFTSFRRSALYNLQWAEVDLDSPMPGFCLSDEKDKEDEERRLPMRNDLAALLRSLRGDGKDASERVFSGILPKWGLGFLRKDMEKAGIAEEDALGRRLDFHGLRHTATTWAASTGASGRLLGAFSGHASESQLARYTHDDQMDLYKILQAMPTFESADGTQIGSQKMVANGLNLAKTVQSQKAQPSMANPLDLLKIGVKHKKTEHFTLGVYMTPTGFEPDKKQCLLGHEGGFLQWWTQIRHFGMFFRTCDFIQICLKGVAG